MIPNYFDKIQINTNGKSYISYVIKSWFVSLHPYFSDDASIR